MCIQLQRLFANLLHTNQKYTDPQQLLRSVVDDSNVSLPIGQEQDVTEYLLNFLERMEEGLGEKTPCLDRQESLKPAQNEDEFPWDDMDEHQKQRGVSFISESYYQNAEKDEGKPIVRPKNMNEYNNSIFENFFGA